MANKLTKDQKRAKQKKEKARQQQQREEMDNKAFKRANAISDILMGTTYEEFDPTAFANALNRLTDKRVENEAIASLRTNIVVRKIEKRTCQMVANHMQCFRFGSIWIPLVGRIYSVHDEDLGIAISSYPQELALMQRMPIEEVAMQEMENDDDSCIGTVYFTGLYLVNGVCHFAAVVTPNKEFEIYIVTPQKWILLLDLEEMYNLYPLSEISIRKSMEVDEYYSNISSMMLESEQIEEHLNADTENAKILRSMIQIASADAINESEAIYEVSAMRHQMELTEATKKSTRASTEELQRLNREMDHLRSRLLATETKLQNNNKTISPAQESHLKAIRIPIEQRMATFFG